MKFSKGHQLIVVKGKTINGFKYFGMYKKPTQLNKMEEKQNRNDK